MYSIVKMLISIFENVGEMMKRQDEKLDMSVEKYLKPYTKRQIENWSNSNKIEIYKMKHNYWNL